MAEVLSAYDSVAMDNINGSQKAIADCAAPTYQSAAALGGEWCQDRGLTWNSHDGKTTALCITAWRLCF